MNQDTAFTIFWWFFAVCAVGVIAIPVISAIVSVVILKRAPKWLGRVAREIRKEGGADGDE